MSATDLALDHDDDSRQGFSRVRRLSERSFNAYTLRMDGLTSVV